MEVWSYSPLQVLLLDEPTAGLDPCSRHHVWSLLKERQAGRVTFFTTQSMEEADVHAGEPRFSHRSWLQFANEGFPLQSPCTGPTMMPPVLSGHVSPDSNHPTQAEQRLKLD